MRMKNRIHFSFRIDMWTDDGENIIEHLAGAEDFTVALAVPFLVGCGISVRCRRTSLTVH